MYYGRMAIKIPGEVVSSHFVDLGEIDPSWSIVTGGKNVQASASFITSVNDGQYAIDPDAKMRVGCNSFFSTEADSTDNAIAEGIVPTITELDWIYRDFRNISDDIALRHRIDLCVGRSRMRSSFIHSILGSVLPFAPAGLSHFDGIEPENEAMLINHGGRPTTMYSGPVWKFSKNPLFTGSVSRFLVPLSQRVAVEHVILFDRNTLHRMSAQIHNPWKPAAFLRDTVSVEPAES